MPFHRPNSFGCGAECSSWIVKVTGTKDVSLLIVCTCCALCQVEFCLRVAHSDQSKSEDDKNRVRTSEGQTREEQRVSFNFELKNVETVRSKNKSDLWG